MKYTILLFHCLGLLSCSWAFVTPLQSSITHIPKPSAIASRVSTELHGAALLGDYTDAAKALFGNLIGPASMLTGGLVPFWLFSPPLPEAKEKWKQKVRYLYNTLCVWSVLNELLAIMYATVASNSLTRVRAAPAASVFALIERDYELAWIGTNVHFLLGLLGFGGMVMTTVLLRYPPRLNSALCGMALAACLGMTSIANVGVHEGDGHGRRLGDNMFSLGIRYIGLSLKSFMEKKTLLGIASFVMLLFYGYQTVQAIWHPSPPVVEEES